MASLPYTGRLLNAIILLVVALSALSLSYSILRGEEKSERVRYFGYFWLATALLWFSSTARNLFGAFDAHDIDKMFFYFTQIFLYISGAYLGPYIAMKIFSSKRAVRAITYLYRALAVVGIFATLVLGVTPGVRDAYSTEYVSHSISQIIFLVALAPILLASIFDSLRHLNAYLQGRELFYETLAPLSIVLYLAVGIVDQQAILGSWQLNLFRLVFLVAFFMAYGAMLQERTVSTAKNPATEFDI